MGIIILRIISIKFIVIEIILSFRVRIVILRRNKGFRLVIGIVKDFLGGVLDLLEGIDRAKGLLGEVLVGHLERNRVKDLLEEIDRVKVLLVEVQVHLIRVRTVTKVIICYLNNFRNKTMVLISSRWVNNR